MVKDKLDKLLMECRFVSNNFERKPLFQEIVAMGDPVVPTLFRYLAEERETGNPWVVLYLLHRILGDRRPDLPSGMAGHHRRVRRVYLDWARQNNLLAPESSVQTKYATLAEFVRAVQLDRESNDSLVVRVDNDLVTVKPSDDDGDAPYVVWDARSPAEVLVDVLAQLGIKAEFV